MSKVHVSLNGNTVSCCGLSPQRGAYDIRTMETFFHSRNDDQCGRCLRVLIDHGYCISRLRSSALEYKLPRASVVLDRQQVSA